jgi:hypothetical protein
VIIGVLSAFVFLTVLFFPKGRAEDLMATDDEAAPRPTVAAEATAEGGVPARHA